MERYFGYARILSTGGPAASASIDVYLPGTTTHATIYSDNSGTGLSNPLSADSNGYFYFYAANKRYDIKFSSGGISTPYTWSDVRLFDPASPSALIEAERNSADGFQAGSYTFFREVESDAAAAIIPSISGSSTVLSYNARWDTVQERWEHIAGGRATALVLSEGSAWMASSTTIGSAGGEITWFIQTKWYADPTGNFGVGRGFDASIPSGEPQGKIHARGDGNFNVILECAGGGGEHNDPAGCILQFKKARGTIGSETNVANGDVLGVIQTFAKSGSGSPLATALIGFIVDGTFTSGQRPPSRITFNTSLANGDTYERLRISANGSMSTQEGAREIVNSAGELVIVVPLVATASLPAAGSGESGKVIIENTGSSYNLIYYAGTSRFRVSGSSF